MAEPSLEELQRWMASRIRPKANLPVSIDDDILNAQRGTAGVERLAVYAGGYIARAREALIEAYEAVQYVVGEGAFSSLALAYAERYPSHDYNLSAFGLHLPELLAQSPLSQRLPFLPDLARLEWAVRQAFHAFDQPPLDPQQLFALSLDEWERTRLAFQASVGVAASAWPIRDIWDARTQPRGSLDIALVDRPQHVLIYRDAGGVKCELIDAQQQFLLEALLAGRTLGVACGRLAEIAGEAELPLAEWFSRWARSGLITRCEPVTARVF